MPLRYIPALIIVIALLCSTVYFYTEETAYINGMAVTEGTVVALGSKSTSSTTTNGKPTQTNTQAIVEFDSDGTTVRVEGRAMGYPHWEIGRTVGVYYAENNPSEARIKRWDEVYFFTLVSAFFLSVCLLFAAINFLVYKVRGKPLS